MCSPVPLTAMEECWPGLVHSCVLLLPLPRLCFRDLNVASRRSGSAIVAAWLWHPQPSKVRDRSQHVAGAAESATRWSPHAPRAASRTADKEFLRELSSIHQLLLSKDSQLQVGARRLQEPACAMSAMRRNRYIVVPPLRCAQAGTARLRHGSCQSLLHTYTRCFHFPACRLLPVPLFLLPVTC